MKNNIKKCEKQVFRITKKNNEEFKEEFEKFKYFNIID